jgi:type II secretory pathway component PulF
MAHFRYQALNAQQQPVAGELHAESVSQAIAQLEAAGLSVQSIGYFTSDSAASQAASRATAAPRAADASDDVPADGGVEQAALVAHMSRVIERGREIVPALRAYAEEMTSRHSRHQLSTVIGVLEHGDAADATAALRALPSYWIPLLSAATSSRDPGRVLREFLKESQRAEELRRQWWQTFAYPLLIAGLATTVLVAISFFVVPVFREMFTSFGLKLPGLTQFVFAVAAWITSGRILLDAAILAGLVALGWAASRLVPQPVREWLSDRFGTLLGRSTAVARFSQFTADLIEAELDIPNALRIAGFATESSRVRRAAWRLAHDLSAGRALTLHAYQPFLTATVLHALRAEMPTTSRVRLLAEISACHAERARRRLSWTRGLIEPLAILAVGVVVGGIVIAVFLPLLSLIQGLS